MVAITRLLPGLVLSLFCINTFAFTSIATIDGQVLSAWYRSNNYDSQKEADNAALEGCRVEARKNGIANRAGKCKVVTRAKGPGYGAVVCGNNGCNWATGYESSQAAVDAAYDGCNKNYQNCPSENIKYWEDFAGFARKPAAKVAGSDCRPRTSYLRCQSSCTNGDCIVSYENGCKMRVQVSPQFNGAQWIYPSPSC